MTTRRHCSTLKIEKKAKCRQIDFSSFTFKPEVYSSSEMFVIITLVKWGTYICAHEWIFFMFCILITHYIQTMKMYLSN